MLRCECGKEIEDYRGARGHVKFTDGDGHGPEGEVPDDYKELFEEVDGGNDGGSSDDSGGDSGGGSTTSSGGSDGSSSSGSGGESDGSNDSDADGEGIVSKILDTDVRELIG